MFSALKQAFSKIYTAVTKRLHSLFSTAKVDQKTLEQLETILIEADLGIQTTREVIKELTTDVQQGKIVAGSDLQAALHAQLTRFLTQQTYREDADVIMLVGVNGSGKTTAAGKLAARFKEQGFEVLIAAADTFRAAAENQLIEWAKRSNTPVIQGTPGQDPASVVFKACQEFASRKRGKLIIDTAGRLQTKVNLMRELEKIGKVVQRVLPNAKISTLIVIDAMLGQNALDQAKLFHESTPISGMLITKLDGSGKGGIVCAITNALHVPIAYVSFGERIDQIAPFDAVEYVTQLLQGKD